MLVPLRLTSLFFVAVAFTGLGLASCQAQQATADAGVNVVPGSTMSFDDRGKMIQSKDTEAYWHGHPGKLYTAIFSAKGSENATLMVQFQGGINWTTRKITTTTPDFAVKATKPRPLRKHGFL